MRCFATFLEISAVALALALGTAACVPLPIPHNATVTPSAVGEIRQSDGSPLAATPVALTASSKDTSCTHAAIRRLTDSAGQFRFPPAKERKHIFWLTLMENPGGFIVYWLCAGTTDSARDAVYSSRTHVGGWVRGDSLDCLRWVWREQVRLTCNTESLRHIVTGGAWAEDSASGTYRVIFADANLWGDRLRGFVQWLEPSATGAAITVRAMAELPLGVELAGPVPGALVQRNGHWYINKVPSTKPGKWGKMRRLTFELGPPGQVRQVPNW